MGPPPVLVQLVMKTYFVKSCHSLILLFFLSSIAFCDTVKMQLSWKHQFQFAGYYAAIEKGFYQDEGMDIELIEGGPGTHCNENILLTKAQYCNGPGSVVKQRIDGESIVALASFVQHSPVVLITLKNSALFRPTDLIGKRVETMVAGVPVPEIAAMFKRAGVELDQLDNRENSMGIGALVTGAVDAMYGFSTNEPYQLATLGFDYHVISPREYGIDFYGDALFTSEAELEGHPKRVNKFLRATIKGWTYAMANKSEIISLILEKYPTDKTFAELTDEADAIDKLMVRDLIEIGHINEGRWHATAETLLSKGMVDKDFSLDGFIYNRNHQEKEDYAWSLQLLVSCLSIAVAISLVLWGINRAMSTEIKKRTAAQNFLSLENQQILEKAYTDELSGMGNRRAFYENAEAEIQLARLDNTPLAALAIDIDHFKEINDNFGHAAGDMVIRRLGAVILEIVRANDVQGRIGGEEFAIITTNTGLEGAEELAERLRQEVDALELVYDLVTINLTVSIGVAAFKPETDDIHSIMVRADSALYQAKKLGRNQVVTSS